MDQDSHDGCPDSVKAVLLLTLMILKLCVIAEGHTYFAYLTQQVTRGDPAGTEDSGYSYEILCSVTLITKQDRLYLRTLLTHSSAELVV